MSVVRKRKQQQQDSSSDEEQGNLDDEGYRVTYHLTTEQTRAKILFFAQLSEEVQDYEALKGHVLQLVDLSQTLTDSERNLFLSSFKNCVGSRRKAWRTLSIQERQMKTSNPGNPLLPQLRLYKSEVELEIEVVCQEMLAAIAKLVSVRQGLLNTKEKVFYFKLRGDYWRYLCEFRSTEALQMSSTEALKAYNAASAVVNGPLGLVASDPQLLGLALNMSVFHYEILGNKEEGLGLCQNVYEKADNYLRANEKKLESNDVKNAKDVLKLLRDNMELWVKEMAEEQHRHN